MVNKVTTADIKCWNSVHPEDVDDVANYPIEMLSINIFFQHKWRKQARLKTLCSLRRKSLDNFDLEITLSPDNQNDEVLKTKNYCFTLNNRWLFAQQPFFMYL